MSFKRHAENRDEYVAAWTDHMRELASLAFAASADYDEYVETRDRINGWIVTAANGIFPEEGK